jgi:hypothetical protein
VERKLVEESTGWHVVFGPVYARDLPAYVATGRKTNEMRQVRFPLLGRLEMAVAWAFPISAIGGVILLIGWPHLFLPYAAMVWTLSLILYAAFPWLPGKFEGASQRFSRVCCTFCGLLPGQNKERKSQSPRWKRLLIFFDPSIRRNFLVWLAFVTSLCGYAYW